MVIPLITTQVFSFSEHSFGHFRRVQLLLLHSSQNSLSLYDLSRAAERSLTRTPTSPSSTLG